MQPIVTLTTDFGFGAYLAQIKAVLLGYRRDLQIIDIAHDIPPQDIFQAAFVLADASTRFPPETYHLAVVDPGVGTDRKLIYVEAGRWRYLLPDNGLIGLVAAQWSVQRVVQLTQSRFWAPNVSATFHGRDIIAHVAGHLLQGVDPLEFGELTQDLVGLPFERSSSSARSLCGWIAFIDRFGNALTSIAKADLVQFCTAHQIEIGGTSVKIQGIQQNPIWSSTYGNHAPGTCVAIFDSQDRLEIAMVNGNAARSLELKVGQLVEVAIATESC